MDTATAFRRPDYAGAVAYALNRLHTELPPELIYHNPMHTEGDVLPAAVRLAQLSNLPEPDLHLLEVAAAFHDLGQIRTSLGHELIGAAIMSMRPSIRCMALEVAVTNSPYQTKAIRME